ncbi:MAG: ABC transporter substrate-binding protein [Chloroflexi bacterium]|nr:ABC transporter substrate-binding protein [Chloroflexota bacterium]
MGGQQHSHQVSRRAFLSVFGASTGAVFLAACGGAAAPNVPTSAPAPAPTAASASKPAATTPAAAAAQPTTATAAQPRSGGTLQAAKLGDVANLDGHYWSPNGGLHVWLSYDTLARYDQNLKPQPQLAESWDVSPDGKQITVKLRQGVTYHSGREFTSDDVVWNLQRALNPKVTVGILGGFFGQDPTFTAQDKYTALLQTSQPWPTVFDMFHVVNMLDKENTDAASNTQTKAVGTGPFVFQEWKQGESMRFTRNPNYWQTGTPYLDEIVVNVRKDAQSMVADLEAGSLNMAYAPTLQDYMRLKADSSYNAQLLSPAAGMYQIQPNVTFKPLDDKRIRQALNYAVDRKRIADTVLLGLVGPEDLPWPPNSPAYEAAKNNVYAQDLDKAKSLLAQAGASNLTLDFVYAPTTPEYGTIAEIYQGDLAKIGVTLNVKMMDIAALFDAIHSQKYNGLYTLNDSWAAMEPVSMLAAGASLNPRINNAGFHDDQYTQLVDSARSEPDAAKRKQIYSQINDYILDQSFGIPVAPSTSRVITKAAVQGLEFRFNDVMYLGNTWMS